MRPSLTIEGSRGHPCAQRFSISQNGETPKCAFRKNPRAPFAFAHSQNSIKPFFKQYHVLPGRGFFGAEQGTMIPLLALVFFRNEPSQLFKLWIGRLHVGRLHVRCGAPIGLPPAREAVHSKRQLSIGLTAFACVEATAAMRQPTKISYLHRKRPCKNKVFCPMKRIYNKLNYFVKRIIDQNTGILKLRFPSQYFSWITTPQCIYIFILEQFFIFTP